MITSRQFILFPGSTSRKNHKLRRRHEYHLRKTLLNKLGWLAVFNAICKRNAEFLESREQENTGGASQGNMSMNAY